MDILRVNSNPAHLLPSRSQNGLSETPSTKAQNEEREAQKRIADSQRQVEDARHSADGELEKVRVEFQSKSEIEAAKIQNELETQRNKGYEALRELKRNQAQEMEKVRREGSTDVSRTKSYYQNEIDNTHSQQGRELDDVRRNTARQLQYEKSLADLGVNESKSQHETQMQHTRELNEEQMAELSQASKQEYERLHEATTEATDRATQHFQERFDSTVAGQQEVIGNLENRASQQIREIRQDTSHKLAAYSSRQKDPFYKLLDFNARVHDEGEAYVMTATIPEYEQKHVSVTLKGNDLVLSGYRRNEEKLELSPGRSKGTAAFQSFHESFPLEHPVDGKQLARYFDGDKLTVLVPKKKLVYEAKKMEAPGRAKVERPHFPDNIPHTGGDEAKSDEASEPSGTPRSRETRTLG